MNLDQNAVLAEIGKIITSSLNIDEVYGQFAELTGSILPHDVMSLNLVDWERELYTVAYRHGPVIATRETGKTLPLVGSTTQRVANSLTGVLTNLSDAEFVRENVPGSLPLTTGGFASGIGVPLKSDGVVHSTLMLASYEPSAYNSEHLILAQKIGSQIAGAIANAQLHMQLSHSASEQDILAEISRILTSSLNIDEVFAEFAELIRPTIPFDRIAMWEIDEGRPNGGILHALGVEIPSLANGSIPPPNNDKFRDMILNRSHLLVSDESAEEGANSDSITVLAVSTGFRSLLAVPMVSRDRVIGLLTFRSRTSHLYTSHHLSLAQRISDQIGGAIDINQLRRISEREGHERRVLAEISRTLTSSLDIDEIWVEFAESIRSLIPFDRIALWEIDENRPNGGTSHSFGVEIPGVSPGTPPVPDNSKFQDLISGRLTLLDPDETQGEDTLTDPLVAMSVAEGFRSLLAVPVVARDRVIGILSFRSRTPGLYTKRHQALAERITDQISGPVAINQMHRISEREGRERQTLAEISRVVSSSPKVSEVYDKFADLVASIINLDRISIGLIDEENGEFSHLYSAGMQVDGVGHGSRSEQLTISLAGTLASDALVSKSPIIISECDRDKLKERFPGLMRGFDAGLRHWLGVPLITEGSVMGVLRIASKTYKYNEHDASTAERIAAQIVGTVANAKLNDDLTRKSAERQTLAEISRIVSSTANLNEIFDRFSELMSGMVNFDQLSITVPDVDEDSLSYVFRRGVNLPDQGAKGPYPLQNSATQEVTRTQNSMIVDLLDEPWVATNIPGLLMTYRHGARTVIASPLISDGEAFGALLLASFQERAYDSHDLEFVDRVGAQIAGALANSELRRELEREATERKVLAELGRIMSSSLVLSEVYERFAEQLKRIVDFDWLILAAVDLETWSATQLYYSGTGVGPLQDGQTVSMADSQGGESVRQRKTLLFHPSSRSETAAAYSTIVRAFDEGFRSYLTAPLVSNDTVVGVITLRSKTTNAYDSKDALLIEQVCNQIAGAFASAKLHQVLEREAHEREVLAELGRVISSSPNIEDVYDEFAELVGKIVPFDRLVIGTVDHEAWTGTVAYVAGMRYATLEPGDTIPLANTQVGDVIKSRSAGILHAPDLQEMSEQYPRLRDIYDTGLQSYLSAPLISSDVVTGILTFRSLAANVYTERELGLAERIALQIAGAISNAQMYAVQEREAREKEVLAEIGRVIGSSLNVEDVYERFASEVGKILEFDRVSIVSIDQARETLTPLYSSGI
ncbi:MAG: GAF domain-containing protein, partial [SAR202 cluster bacterium]|nr:GAF domain-containing protein [SAR202 cluster bacterium]